MKSLMVAICLFLMVAQSVQAADIPETSRDYFNPITVFNDTDYSLVYGFPYLPEFQVSNMNRNDYPFKKATSEVFVNPWGNHGVQIAVAACLKRDKFGYCSDLRCGLSTQFYDLEFVKTIHIKSLYDFEVSCVDGSSTSCLVNFKAPQFRRVAGNRWQLPSRVLGYTIPDSSC